MSGQAPALERQVVRLPDGRRLTFYPLPAGPEPEAAAPDAITPDAAAPEAPPAPPPAPKGEER